MARIGTLFLALTLLFSYTCEAYKILVVFPLPGRSHSILGDGYVKHLIAAGHQVTYITPFPAQAKQHPNLRVLDVSANDESVDDDLFNLEKVLNNEQPSLNPLDILPVVVNLTRNTVHNPEVMKLVLDKRESFDLVIAEWVFSNLYCGFAAIFQAPYIWSSSLDPNSLILSLIDEGLNPAYTPNILSANQTPMSFIERAIELGLETLFSAVNIFYGDGLERQGYQEIFGPIMAERTGKPLPPYHDVLYNASMILGNSNVAIGRSVRLPQNYKAIGGYHIDPVIKPLPEDLQKFMDNAKHGVIYFSLGSNVKSKSLPDVVKQDLLKAFASLKQTVIWKFEENLDNLPKNVRILQWAPQQSILSHPNLILFITHGGLLSTFEAVHFGVPIIGLPVFGDQFVNIDRAVKKGYAKRVNLSYKLAEDLKTTIEDFLQNRKIYADRIKELSLIYHDWPVHPSKELVHWVEHVIRTKGAPHLRSPALTMPFYQKYYLDLLVVVIVILAVVFRACKAVCSCVSKPKKTVKSKRN